MGRQTSRGREKVVCILLPWEGGRGCTVVYPNQYLYTTRSTPTATPLVAIRDGGQNLGRSRLRKGFFFFTNLTPALALGRPVTKCTRAILVGMSIKKTKIGITTAVRVGGFGHHHHHHNGSNNNKICKVTSNIFLFCSSCSQWHHHLLTRSQS